VASLNPAAGLVGKNTVDTALVHQHIFYADSELYPGVATLVYPALGYGQYNKQAAEKAKAQLNTALGYLDNFLSTRTFLVGERVTLADIVVVATLMLLFEHIYEAGDRAPFGNVLRWFNTCINQPQFKKIIPTFELCVKAKQAPKDEKKEEKKKEEPKKEEKKKEEPKKEEKKKEEKKKEEKADEAEEEGGDEAAANEPKFVDPLSALPKSAFVLDEFKRFYSNNDTDKSIPWFWEHFDKEGYSIWRGDYLYNEELKKIYMSCNLVMGMFQRLDKLRKHAFGSVGIFGQDDNNQISGIWIVRGQDLAFSLCDDWNVDAPSYKWTKLDPNAPETKTMVDEYLAWEGAEFKSRAFNQGKIFK
jgi:elongation factor 1-gamma